MKGIGPGKVDELREASQTRQTSDKSVLHIAVGSLADVEGHVRYTHNWESKERLLCVRNHL